MEQTSGVDVEEKPAESKGKEPIAKLLPRLVVESEGDLPRLEVQLSNLELPDGGRSWPWRGIYYVTAWIGPVGPPLRVFSTPPMFVWPWLRSPPLCCRFDLPIGRALKGAALCLELVRVDPRPEDPGTSSGLRVVGRARVKLLGPSERRLTRRSFVLPLYSSSPPPAFVGSVRVDMELVISSKCTRFI